MVLSSRFRFRLGGPAALLAALLLALVLALALTAPAGAHGTAPVAPRATHAPGPHATHARGSRTTHARGFRATHARYVHAPLPPASPPTYLALGDSLAFGYSQAKFDSLYPEENPADYDTGYVDDFAKVLALFEPGLQVVNDGCPGETTESFIKGPCAYQLEFPLHHPYSGGPDSSQLSDALAYLNAHPGTVGTITLDIGANDALGLIEGTCKLEPACIAKGAPAVFAHIGANLALILGDLRAAAPHAQIIVLGLYNPFGTSIAGANELTAALNEVEAGVAASVGARFADPLPIFNPPGGLERPTICLLTNMCTPLVDIHPTTVGYGALAGVILREYAFGQAPV